MAPVPVIIRRIRRDDADRLKEVRVRAVESDPLSFGSTYEETVRRSDRSWSDWAAGHAEGDRRCTLLALAGDRPVGLVRAEREDRGVFGVYSMWVAPEVRRRGVALTLLGRIEEWIRAAGGGEAHLFVVDGAEPAQALYRRAGYVPDGRREPSAHPGTIELGMRKEL